MIVNAKYVQEIVLSAAMKAQLENITKSSLKTLHAYLLEYTRGNIEQLIEVARSARNTSYITNNKNSFPGQ